MSFLCAIQWLTEWWLQYCAENHAVGCAVYPSRATVCTELLTKRVYLNANISPAVDHFERCATLKCMHYRHSSGAFKANSLWNCWFTASHWVCDQCPLVLKDKGSQPEKSLCLTTDRSVIEHCWCPAFRTDEDVKNRHQPLAWYFFVLFRQQLLYEGIQCGDCTGSFV